MKMNERISTIGLAEQLALKTGLDKERTESLINALSDFIIKEIEKNKSVKLIGLGTFRVMLVHERESVHIQTGERFIIPAHHKLSFAPDKKMKDTINKPFAFLEPVETNDMNIPLSKEIIEIEEYVEFTENTTEDELEEIENKSPEIKDEVVEVFYEETTEIADNADDADDIEEEEKPSFVEEITYNNDAEKIKREYYDIINSAVTIEKEDDEETGKESSEPKPDEIEVENEDIEVETAPVITPRFLSSEVKNPSDDITDASIHKKTPLWLWFLMLPFLIIVGVAIGTYAFLQFNSTNGTKVNSPGMTSKVEYTNAETPLPLGTSFMSDSNAVSSDSTMNSSPADTTQQESTIISSADTTGNTQQENTTSRAVKKEKNSVDWLTPTPESKKEAPKRADKPNKEIEKKNKELIEKSKLADAQKAKTENPQKTEPAVSIPSKVKLKQGAGLTSLAREYYGDYLFWVYIYEYNKDKIKDFSSIPEGTEIKLPPPGTYGINSKSPASLEKARKKQAELMKWRNWDDYQP
jgi:nucleoid DNA-binding protein